MALKLPPRLGCCGKGEHNLEWSQRELPCGEGIRSVRIQGSRPPPPEIADEGGYAAWYRSWALERGRPKGNYQRQVAEAPNTVREDRASPDVYIASYHDSLKGRYVFLLADILEDWPPDMYGDD